MFLETRVFNVSWEAEKKRIAKFLNSKSIRRLDVNSASVFFKRASLFFLPVVSTFFFFRGHYTILLVKYFFVK